MFPEIQAVEKEVIELAFLADYGLHDLVRYLNTILPCHKEEVNPERVCAPILFGEYNSDGSIVFEVLAHLQALNSAIR